MVVASKREIERERKGGGASHLSLVIKCINKKENGDYNGQKNNLMKIIPMLIDYKRTLMEMIYDIYHTVHSEP